MDEVCAGRENDCAAVARKGTKYLAGTFLSVLIDYVI